MKKKKHKVTRYDNEFPLISVVVVRSRDNDVWYKECIDSIKGQIYPNIEIVEVENRKRDKSIGRSYNLGVELASGELVLFVGDDDLIKGGYVASLYAGYTESLRVFPDRVGATSWLTAFDDDRKLVATIKIYPTGMLTRKHLLENKFDETLDKRIDTAYYQKHGNKVTLLFWEYGYMYRQHDGMTSGRNLRLPENAKIDYSKGIGIKNVVHTEKCS